MIKFKQSETDPSTFLILSELDAEQMERLRGQIEEAIGRSEMNGIQIVTIQRITTCLVKGAEKDFGPLEPERARWYAHEWIFGNRNSLVEVDGRSLKIPTNDANRADRIALAIKYFEDPRQRWEIFEPWL